MNDKTALILSPHCDDEVIGTYRVLSRYEKLVIIYDQNNEESRRKEAIEKLPKIVTNVKQLFLSTIPGEFQNNNYRIFAPDPFFEIHPLHRKWGTEAEQLARKGLDVVFYTTLMNTPYISEVDRPEDKKLVLDFVYESQKSLWTFDHKFFLFEGYSKWIFNPEFL